MRIWIRRYGSFAYRLLDIWERDADNREVIGVRGLTRAELIHLVENELAVTLEDVLVRRTSAFFWDPTGGLSHVEAVADELERLAGWPPGPEARRGRRLLRTARDQRSNPDVRECCSDVIQGARVRAGVRVRHPCGFATREARGPEVDGCPPGSVHARRPAITRRGLDPRPRSGGLLADYRLPVEVRPGSPASAVSSYLP